MMERAGDIDSVNHVGIAVRDLDKASALYESLGFTLSPLSVHFGATKPDQPPEPLATGNRCAIFPHNYVELLGIVNPGRPDWSWGRFLDRFQGGHIICFGCKDAKVVHERVCQTDIPTSDIISLQRDIGTPEGVRTARFDCVHFDRAVTPEGLIQAARHRNPEYVHQPRYLTHRNGAKALAEVALSMTDPEATAKRYEKLTNRPAQRNGSCYEIDLPLVTRLILTNPQALADYLPGSLFSPPPSIAAMGFSVEDIARVEELLKQGQFTVVNAGNKLIVPAEETLGVVHYFFAG